MAEFTAEVFARLPLAQAALLVLKEALPAELLARLFAEHRGTGSEQKVTFAMLTELITKALVQYAGSGRQSFQAAREAGQLQATDQAVYGKLRRVPPSLSEAFLRETTLRLQALMPSGAAAALPPSLTNFLVRVMDGKKLKRLPKRLLPLRGVKGKILGGKILAELLLNTGLITAMHVSLDGEANDAPLVPGLLAQEPPDPARRALYISDRQFCDLTIPQQIAARGDAFLIRRSKKLGFYPDSSVESRDPQGRLIRDELGWIGAPNNPRRMRVRHITLERPGEEDISLLTNLLDQAAYPAVELLQAYLLRWEIEQVFQQVTEVFQLETWIGSSPQGAVFQFAICALLYNVIQVVRGYVAEAKRLEPRAVSGEMLFGDVRRQWTTAAQLVPVNVMAASIPTPDTPAETCARLRVLLGGCWSPLWKKCRGKPRQKIKPQRAVPGNHSSAYKLLQLARVKTAPS